MANNQYINKVVYGSGTLIDLTGDTVTAADVVSGKKFHLASGATATGNITINTAGALSASGPTVSVPAGYYASTVSRAVNTATHPSPAVSIDVSTGVITASHTQTAGYVNAGTTSSTLGLTTTSETTITPTTSMQTAVAAQVYTVGAVKVAPIPSQYIIPTGTTNITQNGTYNVTQYASTVVSVGKYTGTIVHTVGSTYDYPYVYYNNTGYRTDGSTFNFNGGDTAEIICQGIHGGGSIYINGTLATSDPYDQVQYIFTLPSADVGFELITEADGRVNVTYTGSQTINNQNKTVNPSTATQSITADSGYTGLGTVTVNAMPTGTLGTPSITVSNTGLITAKATVQTAGYLATTVSSTNTSQLTTKAATTITPTTATQTAVNANVYTTGAIKVAPMPSGALGAPTITVSAAGLITAKATVGTAGYLATTASTTSTSQLSVKAAQTYTPSTQTQTITAGQYLTGAQTISGDADLVGSNIISTANIFGVQGTVVIQHYYTGSSAPTSGLGANGDIYLQTS